MTRPKNRPGRPRKYPYRRCTSPGCVRQQYRRGMCRACIDARTAAGTLPPLEPRAVTPTVDVHLHLAPAQHAQLAAAAERARITTTEAMRRALWLWLRLPADLQAQPKFRLRTDDGAEISEPPA